MHDADARRALVFAIAHEVGNHLAGIRLEAHLLDEDLAPHALARASLAIDGLAGRSGPLLALLRPLLAPGSRGTAGPELRALLEGVRRQLLDEGAAGRAVELDFSSDTGDAGAAGPSFDGLHGLLLALVGEPHTLTAPGPIRFRLAVGPREVELGCELPGDAFEASDGSESSRGTAGPAAPASASALHALRGRVLAVAIARVLVADAGGRVLVSADADRSRVTLVLPRAV